MLIFRIESFNQFKKKINSLFPLIYDTKYISIESKKVILKCFLVINQIITYSFNYD